MLMNSDEYVYLLVVLDELPFGIGKTALIEVVSGASTKRMVANDAYMDCSVYGELSHLDRDTLDSWVSSLLRAGCIKYVSHPRNPRWKMLALTTEGRSQITNPTLHNREAVGAHTASEISASEQALIDEFESFLAPYTDQQKHAIITPKQRVLCVAGAGSGKTTVLTQRVRFLTQHRGVDPSDVLAITFTRKARMQMRNRLGSVGAQVVTFNGFCERVLRAHGEDLPIVSYGQKIMLFREACKSLDLDVKYLIREYFTASQRKDKSSDVLARKLMADVFSIIDHFANKDEEIASSGSTVLASTLLALARKLVDLMASRGVRDYSGQLSATLKLFRSRPEVIPSFSHVLVDEYQDVNVAQVKLLELLDSDNLFVVGDPRQSIFGWRGSNVSFINEFEGDCVVQLTKNFRSAPEIVSVMNKAISRMKLPDLVSAKDSSGAVQVLSYSNESEEREAIASLLKHSSADSLFVLARTNRQLEELSAVLIRHDVSHVIREEAGNEDASGIVLSTVHAIKGLEAQSVILMGSTSRFFPCKVSDHPVVELIVDSDVLAEDEELRLLYVALSRAQEHLIITHTGSLTYLLDDAFSSGVSVSARSRDDDAYAALKRWRSEVASEKSLPAYCIFSDKTLRELATIKPSSEGELEDVHGIGPSKSVEYGSAILSVLDDF